MKHFFLRPLHVSWRIAIFCGSFILGVVLARVFSIDNTYLFVALSLALLIVGIVIPYWWSILFMVLAGIILGLMRGGMLMAPLVDFQKNFESQVSIKGNITDDADTSRDGKKRIKIDVHELNGLKVKGLIWAELATSANVRRSDIVEIKGVLQEGFGNFSGMVKKAVVINVYRPTPGDLPLTVRDWFASKIRKSIKEPQASLGIGYLVGQKSALPNDLYTALQISGLTHIVVASGYNLTILVRFARRAFAKVSKFTSTISALTMIISFVAITGLSPSMSRAGLVSILSLVAWYYGRKFNPIILIVFVASITVLWSPSYAWGDIGWLLSFASFLGVIILAPLLHKYFFGEKEPGTVRQILGETISAQLVTLPIILLSFGQLSTISLLANVLILPFIPLAMLFTFIGGLSAIFIPGITTIIGIPANVLLGYMIKVAMLLSEWEWAQIEMPLTIAGSVIFIIVLIFLIIFLSRRTRHNLRETNIIV